MLTCNVAVALAGMAEPVRVGAGSDNDQGHYAVFPPDL
jgi:hypothetical protein